MLILHSFQTFIYFISSVCSYVYYAFSLGFFHVWVVGICKITRSISLYNHLTSTTLAHWLFLNLLLQPFSILLILLSSFLLLLFIFFSLLFVAVIFTSFQSFAHFTTNIIRCYTARVFFWARVVNGSFGHLWAGRWSWSRGAPTTASRWWTGTWTWARVWLTAISDCGLNDLRHIKFCFFIFNDLLEIDFGDGGDIIFKLWIHYLIKLILCSRQLNCLHNLINIISPLLIPLNFLRILCSFHHFELLIVIIKRKKLFYF